MSIGTCQTAQPLFGCCTSLYRFLHPPPHVGVGFRHTQIAGCGRASSRHIFCSVTRTSIRASGGSVWRGATSRTPARAIASGGEGRGARPRATDEQLVGGGQGVCALPSRKEACDAGSGAGREARGCGAALAQAACTVLINPGPPPRNESRSAHPTAALVGYSKGAKPPFSARRGLRKSMQESIVQPHSMVIPCPDRLHTRCELFLIGLLEALPVCPMAPLVLIDFSTELQATL